MLKVILGLLDKLGASYTKKISEGRARKKLTRYVEKHGVPEEMDENEIELMEDMGLLDEKKTEKKTSKKDQKPKGKKKTTATLNAATPIRELVEINVTSISAMLTPANTSFSSDNANNPSSNPRMRLINNAKPRRMPKPK